ncbi:unnamed protein product [marine sediment metagenome]|uniref:Uncharacterized protein n=1 Tax=marine sediment metagenome TaxID=412755 RepID=X0TCE2_9ZZZZ
MEPVTAVMGGVVVAVVSGVIGKGLNNKNNVKETSCVERRDSCILLVSEKIDNLAKAVTDLRDAVNKTV